ncbi:MAG: phosphodiester glycosidase family protein [Oscillospiraceae bacterium]|nr:phosphodiester glycosidase family protein [Oscillospiraceae bacterium]
MPGKHLAEKPRGRAKARPAAAVLTLLCLLLSLAMLPALALTVHPSSSASLGAGSTSIASVDKLDLYANNVASEALSGLTYIRKIYTIDDSATKGYVPNPDCYGTTTDPAEVATVVAECGELLDGQELSWNEDIELRPDSSIIWYADETILMISWQEVRNSSVYNFVEVKIAHPSQFRRMLAGDSYGDSIQRSAKGMATDANAVVAANADFYAFRTSGVNVYQGMLYRCLGKTLDTCFICGNGDLHMVHAGEITSEADAEAIIEEYDVDFSLSFGPIEVENGEVITSSSYSIGEVNDNYSRASLGQLGELHYMIMTCGADGGYRSGATIVQAAAVMAEKGCVSAYALDGGQTAEIVINNKIRNRIVFDSERYTSDIIYFATAIPDGGE